jgi:RNA polymerase sigma-70 factor (ECF subfamily)
MPETAIAHAALIDAAQAGDEQAFAELHRLHNPRVMALAQGFTKHDYMQAEDISQRTWINVWQHFSTFKRESQFATWVYRIAFNECMMWKRSPLYRRGRITAKDSDPVLAVIPDYSPSLEEQTYYKECMKLFIEALSENYAISFVLKQVYELEHSEIAQVRGCSLGCSKSQANRARKAIVKRYGRDFSRKTSAGGPECGR